jgi:hypothetical protein
MGGTPTDGQTLRHATGAGDERRAASCAIQVLTVVDGHGGSMRFEVAGGQAFWLAAGLRRLIGGTVPAGGLALKVEAGEQTYLLSRRIVWGDPRICISELFDPSVTVMLNEVTAEMLAGLMEMACAQHAEASLDAPALRPIGH